MGRADADASERDVADIPELIRLVRMSPHGHATAALLTGASVFQVVCAAHRSQWHRVLSAEERVGGVLSTEEFGLQGSLRFHFR